MGHAIVAGGARASAPVTGIKLGDIAEGSIVKLNESGSPVEFYVAKHDYESGLNGAGRTLLVRKDCYDIRIFDSESNEYDVSEIDNWMNTEYKSLLDESIQTFMSTTSFYFSHNKYNGGGDGKTSTIQRSVFILSASEYGFSGLTYTNDTGLALPISDALKIAYYNGIAVSQWTRSTMYNSQTSVRRILNSGTPQNIDVYNNYDIDSQYGAICSRPCFTLPSGALLDEETMLFNGKVVA